jgi:hypothetical protein
MPIRLAVKGKTDEDFLPLPDSNAISLPVRPSGQAEVA